MDTDKAARTCPTCKQCFPTQFKFRKHFSTALVCSDAQAEQLRKGMRREQQKKEEMIRNALSSSHGTSEFDLPPDSPAPACQSSDELPLATSSPLTAPTSPPASSPPAFDFPLLVSAQAFERRLLICSRNSRKTTSMRNQSPGREKGLWLSKIVSLLHSFSRAFRVPLLRLCRIVVTDHSRFGARIRTTSGATAFIIANPTSKKRKRTRPSREQ
jgi:hypothetical protein